MASKARKGPIDPRLLRYARSSRGFLVLSGFISVAQAACIIAFAWLLARAITGVVAAAATDALWRDLAWLIAVVLVRAVLVWASERASAGAASKVGSQLRMALLSAARRLGPAWLARQNSASLTVTAGHGLDALDVYIGRFLPQLIATVIITPVLVVTMWWQDWVSGLVAIICLPLIPVFMILIGLATRAVQRRQWQSLQRLARRFSDTVAGMGTLRLFGRERKAVASMHAISDGYRRETMKVLGVTFLSGFMLEFLASISVAIIAVSIGLRLVGDAMPLSAGLFVLLLAPDAFLPIRQVGVQFHAATEGLEASDAVFEVLDAAAAAPASAGDAPTSSDHRSPRGATLRLSGMRVHRDRVLDAVTCTAVPGTITLMHGPSGSGKSSVIAALRGAAEFDGEAFVDDTPLASLHPSQWLAWADQRPGLIAGTIASNVALGDTDPADADVAWALATAGITDLHPSTQLGVLGTGLSGGQSQRVAVARALYRWRRQAASVIVLDEPSSALDAATEAQLWRRLRAIADSGATILLVSHRASAASIADQTVRIGAARIDSTVADTAQEAAL